jgi:hypothetical protein
VQIYFLHGWKQNLQAQSNGKLCSYVLFKSNFGCEKYLSVINNIEIRKHFTLGLWLLKYMGNQFWQHSCIACFWVNPKYIFTELLMQFFCRKFVKNSTKGEWIKYSPHFTAIQDYKKDNTFDSFCLSTILYVQAFNKNVIKLSLY